MRTPSEVRFALLVCAATAAGCPKAAPPAPAPTAETVSMTRAAPHVAVREPENAVVSVRLAFRTGSADDPPGKEGLTSLTAHLMAEGGTRALSSAELVRALYPMAAEIDVQVDREMTVFVGRCHRDHLPRLLEILGDVVLQPRMDPKEFERLKVDALHDLTLTLRFNDDENLGKEALETLLNPGHPYGHPVVGTESGLRSLTLADAVAHRANVFGQARLTIGMAGGFSETTLGTFEGRLAALPAGKPPVPVPPPPAVPHRTVLIVEKPTHSTAVSMGFNTAVNRGDPDFHKVRLAMGWFGEHRQMVGKLFNELREERGLNYGDYAYAEEFVQDGWTRFAKNNVPRRHQHFEIWIRPVETKNAVFALRGALWQLDALLARGIPSPELEATRAYLGGYSRLWEQTVDRRLGGAIDAVYYGTPNYLEQFRTALRSMSADEVHAAVRRHLGGRELQIAIVTADGEALRKQLLSGSPTPPAYASPKAEAVEKEDRVIEKFPLGLAPDRVMVVTAADLSTSPRRRDRHRKRIVYRAYRMGRVKRPGSSRMPLISNWSTRTPSRSADERISYFRIGASTTSPSQTTPPLPNP